MCSSGVTPSRRFTHERLAYLTRFRAGPCRADVTRLAAALVDEDIPTPAAVDVLVAAVKDAGKLLPVVIDQRSVVLAGMNPAVIRR